MEGGQLNAERLSGRQLSVAVLVAGLSPAAAVAGSGAWPWMVLWTGAGILLGWLALRRVRGRAAACSGVLNIIYKGWAVVLAARVLDRTVSRMELTSGGSPGFWLLAVLMVPLLWICWGKAAPVFRMVEILWLALAAVLALVLLFGVMRVEWRYVLAPSQDWLSSALAMGEVLAPALFVLPYINKIGNQSDGRGIAWLSALGGLSAALCLITWGILGAAAEQVSQPFFIAAGALGESARCEGLLSVLWLLPDLICICLLCRVWGARRWPSLAVLLSAALVLSGITEWFTREVCVLGSLVLLLLVLFLPGGKDKIVV